MKNLLVVAIALFTLNGVAQKKGNREINRGHISELIKDMTPDEIADLKTKKLVLRLDLTENQQEEIHKIILEQTKTNFSLRKDFKAENGDSTQKPSKDELIMMQNHRLDQKIAFKREMKEILTQEQYSKFEKIRPRKHKRKAKCSKK